MADVKLGAVIRGILPFLLAEIALLVVFILFPTLILVPLRWIAG
jgi:TRAP-type C4-dicarboxylate transport system permease large subunit